MGTHGEDEVLVFMAKHWEELGWSSEDHVVPYTEIGDVGECELGICDDVSWEEVVEVLSACSEGRLLNLMF